MTEGLKRKSLALALSVGFVGFSSPATAAENSARNPAHLAEPVCTEEGGRLVRGFSQNGFNITQKLLSGIKEDKTLDLPVSVATQIGAECSLEDVYAAGRLVSYVKLPEGSEDSMRSAILFLEALAVNSAPAQPNYK